MPRRQRLHRDHLIERLYREAPLNGIWEGTGDVICLDVLRTMQRDAETVAVCLDKIRSARSIDHRLDTFAEKIETLPMNARDLEPVARQVVEMMAVALQASLLVRCSAPAVADAFCATRLVGNWGHAYGMISKVLWWRGWTAGGSVQLRHRSSRAPRPCVQAHLKSRSSF